MTTKELIHHEIENIPEEDLEELYEIVRQYIAIKTAPQRKPSALAQLKRIKIRGPEDFAANLDLYLSGEKTLANGQNIH